MSRGARLGTYCARCVENEILMQFRAGRKRAQDVSLSEHIETGAEGAALSLMDVVSDTWDMQEALENRENIRRLRQAMDQCLTDQERTVIRLRYGLDGGPPRKQWETAHRTGISRSYVSRIEKRALEKLRQALER